MWPFTRKRESTPKYTNPTPETHPVGTRVLYRTLEGISYQGLPFMGHPTEAVVTCYDDKARLVRLNLSWEFCGWVDIMATLPPEVPHA